MKKKYSSPILSEIKLDREIVLMCTSSNDHYPGNGHHHGHGNSNGNHNGHNNPNNPWYNGCDSFVEDPFGGNSPFN